MIRCTHVHQPLNGKIHLSNDFDFALFYCRTYTHTKFVDTQTPNPDVLNLSNHLNVHFTTVWHTSTPNFWHTYTKPLMVQCFRRSRRALKPKICHCKFFQLCNFWKGGGNPATWAHIQQRCRCNTLQHNLSPNSAILAKKLIRKKNPRHELIFNNIVVATYCNTLQHNATQPISWYSAILAQHSIKQKNLRHLLIFNNIVVATYCNILPHNATHCNTTFDISSYSAILAYNSIKKKTCDMSSYSTTFAMKFAMMIPTTVNCTCWVE